MIIGSSPVADGVRPCGSDPMLQRSFISPGANVKVCALGSDPQGLTPSAPNFVRSLYHELQLSHLVIGRHGLAADATGEAALGAHRQLLEGGEAGGLVDAALEVVLGFEPGALGGDEAEHSGLAPGKKPQRLEAAGAWAVV